MRVALTGATGFIGKYVRKELKIHGHDVALLVRDAKKLGYVADNEKILVADLNEDRKNWFVDLGSPDALLHLAWGGLPNYLAEDHVKVELAIQKNFLMQVIETGLRNLVVAGTCYEYGLAAGALVETQDTSPNTPYGLAKDMLRKWLFELNASHDFELTWTRIFYPYGMGQSESAIFSQLKAAILRKDSHFKLGSGQQNIDFISVEEVARLISLLVVAPSGGGIVNVGSGNPQTVLNFVKNQIRILDSQIIPLVGAISDRDFEPREFWADPTKLNLVISYFRSKISDS